MQFKLRVIDGHLQDSAGRRERQEIPIVGPRFVIGTAPDCHMRCSGQAIAPHHCIITVECDRVVLREANPTVPTFLNDAPIAQAACLFDGDRLRVGRLQFGVAMIRDGGPAPVQPPEPETAIADFVVEFLTDADEADRARRRYDPAAREFRPLPLPEVVEAPPKGAKSRPPKRPPVGLPAPPDIRGNDTVDAAKQALNKIITPAKRRS